MKVPMGLMMMEELVRDLLRAKCSYEQIVDAVRVRKPLGEDITNVEYSVIRKMVDESKIGAAVLGSEELGDYFNRLESFDWWYDYSDDHRVWKQGQADYAKLFSDKYQNADTYKMFTAFSDYINGKTEKPKREDYDL